jgi:UDP-N-acetylglucosamine 3-dehydrogenase
MSKRITAAIVGLGNMGRNHARILTEIPEIDFVAAYDSEISSSPHSFNLPIVDSLENLIAKKPDYCVVATPPNTHEEISKFLGKFGINVLIEKPISPSYDSALRIIESFASFACIGGVGHVERFNAALIEAKKRIKNGELGKVFQISTRRLGPFPTRVVEVGVVIDLATHDIDLTQWLLDSEYKSVAAFSTKRFREKTEDLISCVGALQNGVIVSHNVNWLSPLKERKVIVTGEKGTFVVDTLRSDLTFYKNGHFELSQREISHFRGVTQGEIIVFEFEKPEPLLTEHKEFIQAIQGYASSYVSLERAAKTIKVAEVIIQSANTNCVLKIDDVS